MKNIAIKITSVTLLSMMSLTGCDMGSPVAPSKESLTPTPTEQSQNKELPDKVDTKNKEASDPSAEQTFEATDYGSMEEIDIDLMFKKNVYYKVHDIFPQEKYNIYEGALMGLAFMDVVVSHPSFYEPRERGSDAEFFDDTNIRNNMTTELINALQNGIEKDGRTKLIPSADLEGRVKYRLMPIKIKGTPKSKYDTPIIFTEKNKSGDDILAVAGRRTIIFEASEEGSADMKQTIEYYVMLTPDGQNWKISGVGFHTLNPNKLLDSQGKEI